MEKGMGTIDMTRELIGGDVSLVLLGGLLVGIFIGAVIVLWIRWRDLSIYIQTFCIIFIAVLVVIICDGFILMTANSIMKYNCLESEHDRRYSTVYGCRELINGQWGDITVEYEYNNSTNDK